MCRREVIQNPISKSFFFFLDCDSYPPHSKREINVCYVQYKTKRIKSFIFIKLGLLVFKGAIFNVEHIFFIPYYSELILFIIKGFERLKLTEIR